jgi:hypothetical protein
MRSLTTAADRFRAAHGLPATLDAACDAFEQTANGRDAMLFAPSLPPVAMHAPAPAGGQGKWNAHDIKTSIAALAELLARGLGHTATSAASGADRAACHDAAACATRIHYLLTRPGP